MTSVVAPLRRVRIKDWENDELNFEKDRERGRK
jgi:hypothetical protein